MKLFLNRVLLEQKKWDSGALSMLASVIHHFPSEGLYTGAVYRGKEHVGYFHVQVDSSIAEKQCTVDLRKLDVSPSKRIAGLSRNVFRINPEGNMVFYISQGTGGYSVEIRKSGPKGGSKAFDSKLMKRGDLYTITLMQPGVYDCENSKDDSECSIKVTPMKRAKQRFVPPKPSRIRVTPKGFSPSTVELQSTQTLVFQIETPSRIIVELAPKKPSKKKSKQPKIRRRV